MPKLTPEFRYTRKDLNLSEAFYLADNRLSTVPFPDSWFKIPGNLGPTFAGLETIDSEVPVASSLSMKPGESIPFSLSLPSLFVPDSKSLSFTSISSICEMRAGGAEFDLTAVSSFSLSFFVKLGSFPIPGTTSTIFWGAFTSDVPGVIPQWKVDIDDVGTIIVTWYNSSIDFRTLTVGSVIADDQEWYHVIVDVNVSNELDSYIYVNGTRPPVQNGVLHGSAFSNVGGPFLSAPGISVHGSTASPSGVKFSGNLCAISFWRNKRIGVTAASDLYSAYANGAFERSDFVSGSGFISRSPRILIRELDDHPGSYPTVRRTGDSTRAGTLETSFNDTSTMIFAEEGNPVLPAMIPRGNQFNSQAVDIVGEESDITIVAPIRPFQQPTYLHYSPTEEMGPYNDGRSKSAVDFFTSGTSPEVIPGFSSPLRSKIAIEIDITPTVETTFTRNVHFRNVDEKQPYGPTNTGFMYFNFENSSWEQIGIRNPLNGSTIYYDYDLCGDPTVPTSGTLPAQFSVSPSFAYAPDDEKEFLGYSKIGTPISAFGAPNNAIYHATSSQCLKMSNLISSPFLLEAIQVEFGEVRAQRIQGDSFVGTPNDEVPGLTDLYQSGAIRDIDNYVFFAYKQSHSNREKDSSEDVLSSTRSLIFSGSMTFWNSASFESNRARYVDQEVNFSLTHGPAFSYEFGLPYSSSLDKILTDWDPSHDTYNYDGITVDVTSDCVAHFNFETTRTIGDHEPDKTGNGHVAVVSSVSGPEFGDHPTAFLLGETFFDAGAYITNRGFASSVFVISHASDLQMSIGTGFSIAFWVRPSAWGATQFILAKLDAFTNQTEYAALIDSTDRLEFRVFDSSSPDYTMNYLGVRTSLPLFLSYDDVWKHVVLTYNGGYSNTSVSIIVDGKKIPQTATTNGGVNTPLFNPKQVSAPVLVGGISGYPLSGKIGSLEFYSSQISTNLANSLFRLQETPFVNPPPTGVASFTGSIEMHLNPTVCNRQTFGLSAYRYEPLQNVWLGGTSFEKFRNDDWSKGYVYFNFAANPFERVSDDGVIDDNKFSCLFDSRATKFLGNDSNDSNQPTLQNVANVRVRNDRTVQSVISPYLLMPGDELVLGMDAGICSMQSHLFDQVFLSNLTGSHLVIGSKPCKITLFGSLIKESKEASHSLNQDLSSDSIHEIVGAETKLDEFQIEPASAYFGSYLDDIVAGDMATPVFGGISFITYGQDDSRKVVARTSLGQAGSTGSLQRFVRASDTSERTFDSCLPSYFEFFKDQPGVTLEIVDKIYYGGGGSYYSARSGHELITFEETNVMNENRVSPTEAYFYSNQFPFQYNPTRQTTLAGTARTTVGGLYGSDIPQFLSNYYLVNTSLADAVYRVGGTIEGKLSDGSNTVLFEQQKDSIGLGAVPISGPPILGPFRYGVSNTKPSFSAACWRADHFGFFRDMLEPRQLAATFDGTNPIKISFVSGSSIFFDASNTHSQNLSTFATSSLPYFDDGIARNRPDNPDETLTIALTV